MKNTERLYTHKGKPFSEFNSQINTLDAIAKAHLSRVTGSYARVRILDILMRYPGELYILEISELLHMPYPVIVYHLGQLYKMGLLEKEIWKCCAYYTLRSNEDIQAEIARREYTFNKKLLEKPTTALTYLVQKEMF